MLLVTPPILYLRNCRSRKGAWIEIKPRLRALTILLCRSRKGAWIEIRETLEMVDKAGLSLP